MNKIFFLALVFFLSFCSTKKDDTKNNEYIIDLKLENWTDSIRKVVIKEVESYYIDSVKTELSDYYINCFYFHNGNIVKAIGLTLDKRDTVSYYYKSIKTNYLANGEKCPNNYNNLGDIDGFHNYTGLKYNNNHIGIAIYSKCDNSTFEKGLYFKGQKVGKWLKHDFEKKSFEVSYHNSISELQEFVNLKD